MNNVIDYFIKLLADICEYERSSFLNKHFDLIFETDVNSFSYDSQYDDFISVYKSKDGDSLGKNIGIKVTTIKNSFGSYEKTEVSLVTLNEEIRYTYSE